VDAHRVSLRNAFDRHALTYDERFSSSKTAQAIRQEIWSIADRLFPPGSRVLDLGCGTGEDAIHFAERGVHITAIDIAPRMIARVQMKATAAGLSEKIEARVADFETFRPDARTFDGIFSNFGAVNCVRFPATIRSLASRALRPAAPLVMVAMGRLYPLETAVFLLKGDLRRAFTRLRRNPEAAVEGVRVSVWYHSLRNLREALGTDFSLQQVSGLRCLAPSPSLEHVGRFLPTRLIQGLDTLATRFRPTAAFSDHYLTVWRNR
jgi:ubiquinone/menaquinone biosynthesis C-methylase UbiE